MDLLSILVQQGKIGKKDADSLRKRAMTSERKEEEIILSEEIVSEKELFEIKSRQLEIPLREISEGEEPSLEILKMIPRESAEYYKMIPLSKKEDILKVGMIYPEDIRAREALKFLARQKKFSYQIFLIAFSTFNRILGRYRTFKREVTKALGELESEMKPERLKRLAVRPAEVERLAEKAPISRVVAVILKHGVEGNASDIHIEPTREKVRVRFRKDGILHSSIFLPLATLPAVVARIKILSNLKIDETRIPQDGRFSTNMAGRMIDYRVSTFPTSLGEKVTIRILDPAKGKKELHDLGLNKGDEQKIRKAVKKPFGLILASGPTGCGKTTTLYAVLTQLNKEAVNIMTLEDPVEYYLDGVNQATIRPDIGFKFSTGLRSMLRQDPDIIMVGEIRDNETAALAIHAGLTGHIVLSTIHTTDVTGIIPRLIDMKINPFLIAPTLILGVAQRLVRVLCPYCKKKVVAKPQEKRVILETLKGAPKELQEDVEIADPLYIYKPQGCKKCNNTGYSGRIGVFEVLEMTDSLMNIISSEPSEAKIRKESRQQGMTTMSQDGILKVLKGITSLEEVIRVTMVG